MTGVNLWSTTPANNVSANIGYSWNEGMAPAQVNNSARAVLADVRAMANDLIWFRYGKGDGPDTVNYASSTSYTIPGIDVSAAYHVGRRTKVTGSSTGTVFGTISSVAFSTNTTVTVVWDSGSLTNEAITVYLSQVPVTGKPIALASVKASGTNDSGPAGTIGEYISSQVLVGSAVSLSAGVPTDITSISLTAGDWDVWGNIAFDGAFTGATFALGWINIASATLPTKPNNGGMFEDHSGVAAAANIYPVGQMRLSLSGTTTVYLSADISASGGTAFGFIGARRAR